MVVLKKSFQSDNLALPRVNNIIQKSHINDDLKCLLESMWSSGKLSFSLLHFESHAQLILLFCQINSNNLSHSKFKNISSLSSAETIKKEESETTEFSGRIQ